MNNHAFKWFVRFVNEVFKARMNWRKVMYVWTNK